MMLKHAVLCSMLSSVTGMSAVSAHTFPAWFDLRAKDAVDAFTAQCVSTHGDRAQAERVFGGGNALANRLPDDVLAAAEGGQKGGIGWVIRSPNGAVFLLDYDPRGLCGIRLVEADEASFQIAVRAMAKAAAFVAKSTLTTAAPDTRMQDGATVTFQDYSFPIPGHIIHIMLTSFDRKVVNHQHFLTLSYSKPQE